MEQVKLIEKLPAPKQVDVNVLEEGVKQAVREAFGPFFNIAKTKLTKDHSIAVAALDGDNLTEMNLVLKSDPNSPLSLRDASANLKKQVELYEGALNRLRTFKQEIVEDGFMEKAKYEKFMKSKYTEKEWCDAEGIAEEDREKAVAFVESVINYDSTCQSLLAVKDLLTEHAENLKFATIAEAKPEMMFFIIAGAEKLGLDEDYNKVVTDLRKLVGTVKQHSTTTTTGEGGTKKSKLGSYGILLPDGFETSGTMIQSVMQLCKHLKINWKVNNAGAILDPNDPKAATWQNKDLTGIGIGWSTLTPKIRQQLIAAIGQVEADKVLYSRTGDGEYVKYSEV